MKLLLISLFIGTSLAATGQTSSYSSLSSHINDEEKTLSIRISGEKDGRPVQYNRTFNVASLTKVQRDALKNRVLDSLGLGDAPNPPSPPSPPTPKHPDQRLAEAESNVTFTCKTCTAKGKLSISGDGFSMTREFDSSKDDKPVFPFSLSLEPGEYRLMYWQNKVLQIQSSFTVKAGEKNTIVVK
jgi:hypothetical protein